MVFFFLHTLFAISISAKNPVLLVPGLFGSNLYISYDEDVDVPWFCPKKMNDELLWISTKLVLPPFINCITYLSELKFDNETQKLKNYHNVNITVKDFGRHTSVDYIVKNQIKYKNYDVQKPKSKLSFVDNFGSLIKFFVKNGYELGKNLFASPYDWRLAPLFVDDFWIKFRNQIENAYHLSNGQKVTLLGYSMGCFMIQQFLASEKLLKQNKDKMINGRKVYTAIKDENATISQEWIDKYIEKVVFLAPSLSGTLKVYDSMQRRFSPLVPFLRTKSVADMTTSTHGIYSHWPNLEVFKGLYLVRAPDGKNYTVEQLRDLVYNYSNISTEFVPIMDISIDLQRNAPIDIGEKIPLAIIYNSKIPTTSFLDYKNGWNHDPIRILNGKGDGTIPSRGIKYICDNWKAEKRRLICIDIEKDDSGKFKHGKLPSNPVVLDVIYNMTVDNLDGIDKQWWMEIGKSELHLENDKLDLSRNEL
ncbi:hypothetical protein M9Y10_007052 [Tritrichomonas musculus]|uniref:Lecithin:cholesterol acyltransferase family protein n=1 Tax=Tritrichomonas musculus TaxID=1915356 RepID=A0ABR2J0A1_9EUKA